MFYRYCGLMLILPLFVACGGGGGGSGSGGGSVSCADGASPYIGCWVTQGCQSIDNNVNNQPVWGVIRWEFVAEGSIRRQIDVYLESSCSGSPVYQDEKTTDLIFQELDAEMVTPQLSGYRLLVEDITTNGQAAADVLVAITANNELCLSDNLQLSANGYRFIYNTSPPVPPTLDLVNNCLDPY